MIILKSKSVSHDSEKFLLMIGHKQYNLGFQIQHSFVRVMFIWWHICINFK